MPMTNRNSISLMRMLSSLLLLTLGVLLRAGPAGADITTGLVGKWRFSEGAGGTTADVSGNGLTGTLTNMNTTDWVAGKFGHGLNFDAVDGWRVVAASAHVGAVVSSAGAVTLDIDRCGAVATGIRCSGTNVSLFSTLLTIDANEDGSETAAVAAVINPANDDLATGQWLRFNVDGAGTGTQGLYLTLGFQEP